MSQQEADLRERQELRRQQELELQESILMDQMREREEKREREATAALAAADEQSMLEQDQRAKMEIEAKRARLPEEPAVGKPGRVAIVLRLPNGLRLQRAFRSCEVVGTIYDFVDLQSGELAGQRYRLVSNMPRKTYEDRQPTIQD